MLTSAAAARRARQARDSSATPASVADPARGTRVAIALPLATLALAAGWVAMEGWSISLEPAALLALMVAAALAERMAVEIGPRSIYTPSVPPIALAALLGGPLAGLAVGAATQLALTDAVWRRRAAWGGLAAMQGLVGGLAGDVVAGPDQAASIAALTLATMTLVNTAGRGLILADRRARPILPTLLNGARVDLLEAAVVTPLLAVLVLVAPMGELLAVVAMGGVIAAIAIAHRQGEVYRARLDSERAIARRDPLTGTPNRRALEEALDAEHARVVRGGHPAGLLVVDVDRFKSINDEHRHDVGDAVLREILGRLARALRPSDTVGRWGGDEITVIAPGVHDDHEVVAVAERIRALVAGTPVETARAVVHVTVSVGGTLLDGSVTPVAAVARADEALYEAKRTRNATAVLTAADDLRAAS